jgi:hypothetical protein
VELKKKPRPKFLLHQNAAMDNHLKFVQGFLRSIHKDFRLVFLLKSLKQSMDELKKFKTIQFVVIKKLRIFRETYLILNNFIQESMQK